MNGFSDYEFDGALGDYTHEETGPYVLTAGRVNPGVLGGGFADSAANQTRSGANTISIGPSGAAVSVAQLSATLNDVDYFRLELLEGQVLSAITAPLADLPNSFDGPDTLMGLFDESGSPLLFSEDAGEGGESDLFPDLASDNPYVDYPSYASALRAVIPENGTYYLGVTGFGDENFVGLHDQFGRYALLVGVQAGPPPSLPGDFNEDGTVDAADYVVWRKFFGDPYDEFDYDDWVENFGEPSGAGAAALASHVPEPTAACLLFAIALLASAARPNLLPQSATFHTAP